MDTDFVLLRYWSAKTLCTIGRWIVERAIEIAGEGTIDIWFETSLDKPLPTWLKAIAYTLGLILFWFATILFFAATGD